MEQRIKELLQEYRVPAEDADRIDLIARLALRVVSAEQRLERLSGEIIAAAERGVAAAKKGDLRKAVRGDLLAAVTDKAGAFDAALMEVAERREALALAAEIARLKRTKEPTPEPKVAERDQVTWVWSWDQAKRRGTVQQLIDDRAWVHEPASGTTWVLPAAELTKVESAMATDHALCAGFDRQLNHWHCYTHELFEQPW